MAGPAERDKVRLSLDVSPELYTLLESLAARTDESKSDVLRKAIVLMDVAVKASQEGKRLLVEEPFQRGETRSVTEIVGLFPPKAETPVASREVRAAPADAGTAPEGRTGPALLRGPHKSE